MADQMPVFDGLAIAGADAVAGIAAAAEAIKTELANWGGGSYQFTPSELQTVIKQWTDLQTTVNNQLHGLGRDPQKPAAPGNEQASDTVTTAAHTSNSAYLTYLNSMKTYVDGYVTNLTDTYNRYMNDEQGNAKSLGVQNYMA